ncbi:MAG: hypothetical protein HOC41_03955 [Candidatus Marinimicrobia bacterium]|jgi:hypothetical protein|nr:hypothetical protein [Candidatus Neomarinimicrobiota bacterium]MBT3946109.1 hypothetical protein [Candidatus Neomarinimicrobiota bacterium]MBT4554821.1 hypothetical protein [Candidatus Neomarinimicrobiota bacterium]MBT5116044.1 hypothetical protein [Candidatus Neomarinimicrobiota bacterium]MBT5748219.1 hypothetical protein [Candidatus Neomarinimicrobiota bacterium]|tara:strand:- start:498 stop:1088 length:591 start_codon:yes stop_codon:yes gene_type:complete
MKKLLSLFLLNQLFALDLHGIELLSNWEILKDETIQISWQNYQGFPVSKAETILNHSIKDVSFAIQDLDHYPEIFDRVTQTIRLEKDVIQIVLDMPFPFDGRDYIVKYSIENQDNYWVFAYSSVEHPKGRLEQDHVRLPNAGGIWILEKVNESQTKIVYAWNGELLGNFPDIALTRAWVTQGTEVLNWLDEFLTAK